jgi:adenylate cyclase
MRTPREQRLRDALFLAVGIGTIGIVLLSYGLGVFDNFERQSVDARFSIRGAHEPPKDLIVVGIDPRTFSDLNLRWPFSRKLHAKAIDLIAKDGARAIAYDVQFSEYGTVAEDNALGLAIQRHPGKVVLATTEVSASGQPNLIFGSDALQAIKARVGDSNFQPDTGNVIRKLSYEVDGLKAFAVVAAEVALGHPIPRSELGGKRAWIDFAGGAATVREIPFSQVVGGRFAPGAFHDRVVVVGATAPALQDIHATSTSAAMPGPEVQANAIETALHGFPLKSAPQWLNVLLIVVFGLMAPALSLRFGLLAPMGSALATAVVFVIGNQLAFNSGRVVGVVVFTYPLASLTISSVGTLVNYYVIAAFERERVRDVFSRFVPDTVVDQVLARAGQDLRLGGEELEVTVMFSDLRGFTSSAEHLGAAAVIDVLNMYLGEMSDAILDAGGTLVSYMGDGIYALFGAPIPQPDHADRALAASRDMLDVRLPKFNAWMRETGHGSGYRMGIGLNTGTVMSGQVGHERRVEYTAVGDTTNTASRIEGMTKGQPYMLFVAESTYALLQEPPPELVFVEEFEVRGREQKLKIWGFEPQPLEAEALEPAPTAVEAPDVPAQVEPA